LEHEEEATMLRFARVLGSFLFVGILAAIATPVTHAADEPIVVVVKLFPAEGREDEAQARLSKLVKFVPANNPGVTFRLHRSTKKPVVFLLYETFPSQASLDTQQKSVLPAFLKEVGATPEGLFAKPNEVEFYSRTAD
jgi:quinol monooxygenase YgiN